MMMKRLPTLHEFDTPVGIKEILPLFNERSESGRVVVNPPKKTPPLKLYETGESWFICRACGRSYLCKDKYLNHISEHKGEGNTANPQKVTLVVQRPTIKVSISFNSEELEITEAETGDDKENSDPLTTCQTCGKTFSTPTNLKKHMTIHGEKRFKCTKCPSKFAHSHVLTCHLRDCHTKENKFKCLKCSYRLATEIALKNHCQKHHQVSLDEMRAQIKFAKSKMRKELDVEPSNSKTKRAETVTSTARKQSNVCHICQVSFCDKRALGTHIRIHTGEKPFACNQCGFTFRSKSAIHAHTRNNHTSNKFACPFCTCGFNIQRNLTFHVQKYHPKK